MTKRSDRMTVILFCGLLAVLAVAFLIMPDKAFSEQENRALAQVPTLDAEAFFSGKFASDTNTYFADQFPFRNFFVKLKSSAELAFLKGENNGVLYSKEQLAVKNFNAYRSRIQITEDTDRIYLESAAAQLRSVSALGEKLDIPLITVLPPRTIDIADSVFSYDRPDGDAVFDLMNEILTEKAGYIDTLSLLRPKFENGSYVYYRTDHHWTTEGAYAVYCEIMARLDRSGSIIPADAFEIERIAGFSGTTAARANFPFCRKDVLELWKLSDEEAYTVIADGEELGGFYSRSHLATSDRYAVFLDGTHNVTTIAKKNGESRETLLIAKDSFANCLIPFLAREFDIVAVNLRTNTNLSALAEQYQADAVLIVYNTENLITSGDLGNVR